MRQSKLFTKTAKNAPRNEITLNAQLLARGGFIYKVMAGVYAYLPLGLRVLNKVREIIRQEMDAVGGQEILMPVLHPAKNWQTTGGWDKIDVLFKLKSRTGKDYALGQSHEEIITPIAKETIKSYKDLPLAIYQIHWKYRDELRAKSGILRGREFEMKDMYSFHANQEDFEKFYEIVKKAYLRAYQKLGLTAKVTEASGGSFSEKISYEFMVLTDAGEDDILYCPACEFCVNSVIVKQKQRAVCPKCGQDKLLKAKASEVGNVFDLGQKYSQDFGLTYTAQGGQQSYPIMGCYGWGTTRTMGVLVEKFNDKKGIIWPEAVAPFKVHLISIDETSREKAEEIYSDLSKAGIEVLYDDRVGKSAGEKFADADLIGIPYRTVVSGKTIEKDSVEIKKRDSEEMELVKIKDIIACVK